jgi:hypothetical protein
MYKEPSMRLFYAVYVQDAFLQSALNVVRYLCKPTVIHEAHITVRGPYTEEQNISPWSEVIAGKYITVDGVSAFRGPQQNTVYLRCEAPEFEHIWWKQDYGFNPHLTLYDGSDARFAQQLETLLTSMQVRFSFRSTGLKTITSFNAHFNICETNQARMYDLATVGQHIGIALEHFDLCNLATYQRLDYVGKVMNSLVAYARQNTVTDRCIYDDSNGDKQTWFNMVRHPDRRL